MDIAIKLIQTLVPLVIAFIQNHHPDKNNDEHDKIVHDLVSQELTKCHHKEHK